MCDIRNPPNRIGLACAIKISFKLGFSLSYYPLLGKEIRGGGNIKLVGIKFRPRPPERSGAGGGH